MIKQLISAAFLFSVVACGGGGKKDEGPGKDWSSKPLDVTITDKVKNIGFRCCSTTNPL